MIRDRYETTVFQGYTDEKGMVPQFILLDVEQTQSSLTEYNPYTISVWKDGYLNHEEELSITSYTRKTIQLDDHILPVAIISGDMVREDYMDYDLDFDGSGSSLTEP